MQTASDFRRTARQVLQGKWVLAIVVGLIAVLLGIGNLWLTPYTQTANTAFYRDLTAPTVIF